MSSWRQASATSGSSAGGTTKAAPASFASRTAPGSHTVPTPTGYRPIVVAINPRIISKHEGTVFVTSIVLTPPSMAVRQAWKPASALSVRSTPHTPLGKASAIDFIDRLRLVEGGHHPQTCDQAPIESESATSPCCIQRCLSSQWILPRWRQRAKFSVPRPATPSRLVLSMLVHTYD